MLQGVGIVGGDADHDDSREIAPQSGHAAVFPVRGIANHDLRDLFHNSGSIGAGDRDHQQSLHTRLLTRVNGLPAQLTSYQNPPTL